jgi:hypothetical protein
MGYGNGSGIVYFVKNADIVRIKKSYYFAIRPISFFNYVVEGPFCITLVQEPIGNEIERTYFAYWLVAGKIQTVGLGSEEIYHRDMDWQEEFFRLATEDEVAKAMMLGL